MSISSTRVSLIRRGIYDMKALTSTEFVHLEDLRSFYQRCREVDGWRE